VLCEAKPLYRSEDSLRPDDRVSGFLVLACRGGAPFAVGWIIVTSRTARISPDSSLGQRLVVVGAGMAAARLARELRGRCPDRWRVTLVGAEPQAPYDRIQLSAVLAGERQRGRLALLDADELAGVELRLGTAAVAIDRADQVLDLADGSRLPYDRLVIATGSTPVRLPVPGSGLPGVAVFRDLADVDRLAAAQGRAVVIGGGLLGLEAAYGLRRRGLEVTLVHLMPWLMERQLNRDAGALLRQRIEALGIEVLLGAETEAVLGCDRVAGLRLKDGRELSADLVVMAVGIRPEVSLALAAGLACGRGVQVDDGLTTSDPRISALGECAEHRGLTYGLVWPAYEQAHVLARRLAGEEASYPGSLAFTSLKVGGVPVWSGGEVADDAPSEALTLRDGRHGHYRRLLIHDGRLKGAVLVGDIADGAWYAELIGQGTDVGPIRDRVAFGRAFVEAPPMLGLAA
jgi:nitrite reductase (NADH) large subunit